MARHRHAGAIVAVFTLAFSLAGCGFFGGGADVAPVAVTQVAGVAVTPTVIPLTNDNWDLALKDADRYRGSPVDITGQVFNAIGSYEGASHYQLFANPRARTGNTHLAVPPDQPKLQEGDTVHVVGTLDRMLVTGSRAGSDLRLPYVVATGVELLSGSAARGAGTAVAALATPVPSPSSTSALLATSPSPTSAPPAETSTSPTATAPPSTATPAPLSPSATAMPATPTTAPTRATSPTPTAPFALEVPPAAFTPASGMQVTSDLTAPGGQYLSTSKSSRDWNGTGAIPAGAGTASFTIDVSQSGRYAVWTRMQYQNVDANSLWLVVDNRPALLLGNEDGGYRVWRWVGWHDGNPGARVAVDLGVGQHTLTVVSREGGTRFDSLLLTDDLNYKPANPPGTPAGPVPSGATPAPPPATPMASDAQRAAPATPVPTSTAAPATTAPPPPTALPTIPPAAQLTAAPTAPSVTQPTVQPTAPLATQPTSQPTASPTPQPTKQPTPQPTAQPTPQPTAQPTPQQAGGTYTVQPGDTLSAIAGRVYGDPSQFPRIFDANRDKLSSPDRIMPGQQLRIPR